MGFWPKEQNVGPWFWFKNDHHGIKRQTSDWVQVFSFAVLQKHSVRTCEPEARKILVGLIIFKPHCRASEAAYLSHHVLSSVSSLL